MMINDDSGLHERLIRLIEENEILRSALDKTNCGKALIRQQDEFSLLLDVSKQVVSELDLEKVFYLVANNARNLVDAELLVVPMLNSSRDRYTYMAALGTDAEAVLNSTFAVHVGMCGWVLQNEQSLLFGEASPSWLDEKTQWEEGQQSALLVPLFGRTQIIGGISALGKRGGGSFSHHDLDLLTIFATQVSTAIENAILFSDLSVEIAERKKAEDVIARSLKEKNILLAEIHHRVRNNMAIVTSLLRLQSRSIKDKEIQELFRKSQNRIRSMALVHDKLYQTKDFSSISIKEYIQHLSDDLVDYYRIITDKINLIINVDEIKLNIETLIPCGLIINELITNSLKYAFDGIKAPEISISLKKVNAKTISLNISDNGSSLPEEIDISNANTLGLQLVSDLINQIGGQLVVDRSNGTEYKISFEIYDI